MMTPERLTEYRKEWLRDYFSNVRLVWQDWYKGHISFEQRDKELAWYRTKLQQLREEKTTKTNPTKESWVESIFEKESK